VKNLVLFFTVNFKVHCVSNLVLIETAMKENAMAGFVTIAAGSAVRSKGSKWGHAPWSAGLGGTTAHFLQSF